MDEDAFIGPGAVGHGVGLQGFGDGGNEIGRQGQVDAFLRKLWLMRLAMRQYRAEVGFHDGQHVRGSLFGLHHALGNALAHGGVRDQLARACWHWAGSAAGADWVGVGWGLGVGLVGRAGRFSI